MLFSICFGQYFTTIGVAINLIAYIWYDNNTRALISGDFVAEILKLKGYKGDK